MIRLLRIKHWRLFLLVIFAPLFLFILSAFFIPSGESPFIPDAVITVPFLSALFFLLWVYSIGRNFYPHLINENSLNIKLFQYSSLLSCILALCLLYFFYCIFASTPQNPVPDILFTLFPVLGLLLPLTFVYTIWFASQVLTKLEDQQFHEKGNTKLNRFLIIFFGIGVWIIQPRVNKLHEIYLDGKSD
jgi:hypothetical protein